MAPTEAPSPWMVVVPVPPAGLDKAAKYVGDGRDILLQGFHWHAHRGGAGKSWYRVMGDNAERIKQAGFTSVWFPPPSDSASPEGYMPRRWNFLNTAYGTEAELRAAIQALQPVRALADVVVNHRDGVATRGPDFEDPRFPDNAAAVTCDDDSGAGKGNRDTGEATPVGRDLDHTNPDVRAAIKEYLKRLRAVGFRGWRYDLAKGYHGRFVGEFNDATAPEFSVGEFFDGDRQKVTNWIDQTGGKSAAFDFPSRFILYQACISDDYGPLRSQNGNRTVPGGLIGMWPSHAVTFLDNHDTEFRRDGEYGNHHFPGNTVAMGYAYLMTHPGVPCVFWPHYFDWGRDTRQRIDHLIQVRKAAGIHARSGVEIHEARHRLYAATIDGRLAVKLGSDNWSPGGGWQLRADGEKFAVWNRR